MSGALVYKFVERTKLKNNKVILRTKIAEKLGRPRDIIEAVYRGVDIFDCVIPTREGRHGLAYVGSGSINLKNSKFENDLSPLNEKSDYFVSNKYSKSYLNHLLKIKDPLGSILISLHNLHYYYSLMRDIRRSI